MKSIVSKFNNISTVRGLQIFQGLRFLSIFSIGAFFAKWGISLESIGLYESIMFLSGAISFFWVSGILNGLISKYGSLENSIKENYLFNVAILIGFINLLIVILLLVGKDLIHLTIAYSNYDLFLLFLIYVLLNNPSFFNEYFFIVTNRGISLLKYGVFNFILTTVAVITPILLGYGIYHAIFGLIFSAAIRFIIMIIILKKFTNPKINLPFFKEHLYLSLPLIMSMLVSGSAEYIDSFLVTTNFGPDAFAIFRYGAKEFPLSLVLANALSTAIVPKLNNHNEQKNGFNELIKESKKLMNILFPITIVLLLSSTWLYPLIFRSEFASSAKIFNVFLLLLISRMIFPQSVVLSLEKTSIIFKIAIIEITINVIASYLLMLKFGPIGVAYGTVIAFVSEKVLLSIYLKSRGISFNSYVPVKLWGLYSIILILTYIFVNNFF